MQKMSRRSVLTAAVALAAAASVDLPSVLAQSATPGAAAVSSALTRYPVLAVTITDKGYDLSTDKVPAGYVLFSVTNKTSNPAGAAVLGPAKGQTMDDMMKAAATPAPDNGFPAFLYHATILGGPGDAAPDSTTYALLNIPAGDWVVFGEGNQPPTPFTAAKAGKSNTTEPKADAEVVFGDFKFEGLDKLKAGERLWKITNKGAQPHMLAMAKVPAGTTEDQVLTTVMSEGSATPVTGSIPMDQVQFLNDGVLLLSTGQTMWLPINLDAGTYAAVCFVTDPSNGKPHAMEGMIKVFTIS